VHDNENFGIQAAGKGSSVQAHGTTFANHVGQSGIAIITMQGAVAYCNGCTFSNTQHPHCELRQGATVTLENCDLGPTNAGIGLQAHDGGILELKGTKLHGCAKFGIMVGENGLLKAWNSTLCECGVGALYTNPGCNVELVGCTIENNGQFGMQLTGGVIKTSQCTIRNHTAFGVVVFHVAQFGDDQNQYLNNGQQDVFHQ
jgi:hypothetical protein